MKCPKCGQDHTYDPEDPDASICRFEHLSHPCAKCRSEMAYMDVLIDPPIWRCKCGHEEKVK